VTASAEASVTVIIAAYNCEAFLGRAIASVTGQTLPPAEILIVDDCSTDGTREVIRAAAAADPRVKLIALPATPRSMPRRAAGSRFSMRMMLSRPIGWPNSSPSAWRREPTSWPMIWPIMTPWPAA
jgi:cellulose synthase/poly-beta-1,6-N-acetylglucosamine synthase-like glycosyltransferase